MTQTERLQNKALGFLEEAEDLQRLADSQGRDLTSAETVAIGTALDNHAEMAKQAEVAQRLDALREPQARKTAAIGPEDYPSGFSAIVAGQRVPVLSRGESLARYFAGPKPGEPRFTLADYARGQLGHGPQNVASGTSLVPAYVSSQVIDAIRAQSVLVAAGAGTIPVAGPVNLCRVASDPTIYEHTEAAADISETDVTLESVTANPRALVAAVPLTHELVADSPNLDLVLRTSLAGAFAAKLDAVGLAAILADSGIPTSSAGQNPATWAGVLAAVAEALAADQRLPSAYIGSEADFVARASQLASTAGSWLGRPPALAAMAELFTTNVSAGTAVFGDFARGVGVVARAELQLEVVRFAKATSYSHLLVAHMRMAAVVLQPGALFIQQASVS